ncbi:hypothetical protein LTR10_019342 [Elasticomyces elasticus]|uniref:Heterokaryon incompatibility domain-containing protein n=1 Tax=Exophiala sideris TaxID=1016849 RepID=A0ABR0J1F7_9EURO|nr:hypothetical protein LTR10_019342 [Elasticomyces elasticus]KAK5024343.1 hypothetical protein LTS07_008634 [Exophiala sideris]KAK5030975.1 hypothetical protein LTR13_007988 [Exophiala sideris]KAK5054076.1 hypothetical protein LTR69_009038 [Exophiala sideris]KAK5179568.1 hypothetical protein LTR44_008084 [Eurotiomycetes sp. CCFEE 6388]
MYYAYRGGLLEDTKDHGKCTAGKCFAYQIDPQVYETKHATPNCDCDHIEPPTDKVRSILSSGGLPIISFASPINSYQDFDIDVIEASDEIMSNSLPGCQLRHLRDLVANCLWQHGIKYGLRVQLWIDTLCVPLDEPLRGRAIELIKDTFEGANEVLVLDGRLRTLSSKVDYIENAMRVACSGWLGRLWTYLEGVLAKKLTFQFADDALDIRFWILGSFKDKSAQLWNFTGTECIQFYWLLRRLDRYDSTQRVARLWNALQWRSTSRTSDETICVASLFKLDLSEILRTPVEKRMTKLLEMQQWFPPGIIFMDAERLAEEGFGWAPKSFLARQPNELGLLNDERPPTRYNGIGLLVQYPGFLLTVAKQPLSATFFMLDKDRNTVHLMMQYGGVEGHSSASKLKCPAIISSRDPSYAPETVSILVDIIHDEDGCKHARIAGRGVLRKDQTNTYDGHVEGLAIEAELDVDEYLYATATSVPIDQQWCLV